MAQVEGVRPEDVTQDQRKRSLLLTALYIAQEQYSYLSREAIRRAAERVGITPNEVYQMASFYSLYRREPVGQYLLQVCAGLSCCLCDGGDRLRDHIVERLGIQPGQTTADGRFTLKEVQCLASCGTAPMMQVNETYHENLTVEKVDALLEEWMKDE